MTRQRVKRALTLLARIIVDSSDEDASSAAPIYDRLERELAAMDVKARARAWLDQQEA